MPFTNWPYAWHGQWIKHIRFLESIQMLFYDWLSNASIGLVLVFLRGIPDANEYESFAFADLWLFVHSAVYNLRETP